MLKGIQRSTAGGSRDQGFDVARSRAFCVRWPGYLCPFKCARMRAWLRQTVRGVILGTSRSSLQLRSLTPLVLFGCLAHLCFLPALPPLIGDGK